MRGRAVTLADFISLLAARDCQPSGNGTQFSARCPAHEDGTASLSVSEGKDGRTIVHCHAGCRTEDVLAKLNLTLANLFNGEPQRNGKAQITATYDYTDEAGALLFQVCRFEPKGFRQRRPDGAGGWEWKLGKTRRVLFRLPELLRDVKRALPIFVCEGEKDVLALVKNGLTATCNPGGAGKWVAEYSKALRGADVVIVADKDEAGRNHAQLVARSLDGIARRVRVVELPDANGKAVKDAHDFFAAGGDVGQLQDLVDGAPDWKPLPVAANTNAPATGDFAAVTARIRGEIVAVLLDKETSATVKYSAIAAKVVETLGQLGRFYSHADLRDFDSAMYFDSHRKLLERISSDSFAAWLSEWLVVNRANHLFKYVAASVENAALFGAHTTAILPEAFWAARPGGLYLSNGDGAVVRITGAGVESVDNGTDGVLFSAGRTLAPWRLTTPQDPFETCSLFRNAHSSAAHGRILLQLWLYSFPTMPRSKPPLGAIGEIGCGKTRTLKGIAELYGIPFRAAKVEEQLEPNFWPNVNEGGLFTLDNADSKCRWLADAVAAAATDGCSQRRKLYTNSETVTLRANAWLAITSANPTFGNDAGLADRLLPFRMERRGEGTSDAALGDEIRAARDAGLSHIAETLRRALADTAPTPPRLNARHPDFAAFAVKIGRALGREAEAVAALQAAESDKSAFCLENDSVASALLAYVGQAGSFTGSAKELLPHLVELDDDLGEWLTAKKLGKRLSALWPHLQHALQAEKGLDRNKVWRFTFQAAEPGEPAGSPAAPAEAEPGEGAWRSRSQRGCASSAAPPEPEPGEGDALPVAAASETHRPDAEVDFV